MEQYFFVSKHVVFLEKEFLLIGSRSKVELEEVQGAQTDVDQLPEPKVVIHKYEIVVDPSKAQVLCRTSRIRTILRRYGFLISEHKDIFLIENDEPTTYGEYRNILESNKWLVAMKS